MEKRKSERVKQVWKVREEVSRVIFICSYCKTFEANENLAMWIILLKRQLTI